MGATVTTGKLAAAFATAAGKIIYVLFEQTYEKNCHPHRPEWSCTFIGSIEMAMKWIFLSASSCESGMLQNRSGQITPEGYIAGWLKELASPVEFQDRTIELKIGDGFYSTVPAESSVGICDHLTALGRQDIAVALKAGHAVPLSLHADAELIAQLYGSCYMRPWRIIRSQAPVHGLRNTSLGYAPTQAPSAKFNPPAFLKADQYNRLIQRENGTWYCGGWEYSIVGHFVCRLWEEELRAPGCYRARIKVYRDAVACAPEIPEGMKVLVDLSVPLESVYQREWLAKLPNEVALTRTEKGYEIPVAKTREILEKLVRIPEKCSSWVLPKPLAAPRTEQLCLLME